MLKLIAALSLAIILPAHAQYGGGYSQGVNDSAQINLMKAQTEALQNYSRCLQTATESRPCQPPQPVQIPQNQPPPQNQGGFSQSVLASAQSNLMKAQADAIRAYGQCVNAKSAAACGPSP